MFELDHPSCVSAVRGQVPAFQGSYIIPYKANLLVFLAVLFHAPFIDLPSELKLRGFNLVGSHLWR